MRQIIKLLISSILLFAASFSWATVYPAQTANNDVIYMDDFGADLAAKLYLINHAKHTIELSTFGIGHDQYGDSVVRALRSALQRGVKVKIIYESLMTRMQNDYILFIEDLLLGKDLDNRAEMVAMKTSTKIYNGLTTNDYIHQKLYLFDRGTEDAIVYFGGRDAGEFTTTVVDSGYLVRPIDPKAPYLGDEFATEFDAQWAALSPIYKVGPASSFMSSYALMNSLNNYPVYIPSGKRMRTWQAVKKVLLQKPKIDDQLATFQFRPASAQVITNDLIIRAATKKFNSAMGLQPEEMASDDILNQVVKILNGAKDVQISAYSADYAPPLADALAALINAGGKVTVYTDGEAALKNFDTSKGTLAEWVGLAKMSFFSSMETMRALTNKVRSGGLTVFGLDLEKTQDASWNELNFLHRKLMIVDEDTVITGSSNFTIPSSTKNDEMMVVFKDANLNTFLRVNNKIEEADYFTQLNPNDPKVPAEVKQNSVREYLFHNTMKESF